jgi:hypothetical protein
VSVSADNVGRFFIALGSRQSAVGSRQSPVRTINTLKLSDGCALLTAY